MPANIHRANVVWSNKTVAGRRRHHRGRRRRWPTFFTDLDKLKAKGVKTPLAVGKDWTQLMLFESVLITDLGADKFTGLWNGTTDWTGADVTKAINDFKKLLDLHQQGPRHARLDRRGEAGHGRQGRLPADG